MERIRCACFFGIVALLGNVQAAPPEGDYFPPPESKGGWRKLAHEDMQREAAVDPAKLAQLKQWLLESDTRDFAAVVIRRGSIVLEVERGNSAKTDSGRVASVSKAICATVLAIAAEQSQRGQTPKKMKFDDAAFDFMPWARPLSDARKERITVKQLLNHTSGICPEATGAPNDGTWQYIFGQTGDERTAKLAFDPGTACGYSTHAFHHAAMVCETVTGQPYDQFAIKALFEPVGIEHWWFQRFEGSDQYGRHPSHSLGMPARDLARIGYCMLRDGRWKGRQVIPKWFVNETGAATHDVTTPEMRWKLNPQIFSHGWELPSRHSGQSGRSGAGIPGDARAKPGSGGQLIAFVPSLDLVVARQTGSSGEWQYEECLRRACEAVRGATASAVGLGAPIDHGKIGAGEGPAWHPEGHLLFTGGGRITKRDVSGKVSVFREDGGGANGLLFDHEGRLVVCEGSRQRVTRTEHDGIVTVLAENYGGARFNTPNDLTIDSRGRIYFTDPRYGSRANMEIRDENGRVIEGVYRIDKPGKVTRIIAREVERPNGILVTPGDEHLYVADNNNNTVGGARKLWRFDLRRDGSINPRSRKLIFDWKDGRGPDGVKMDERGRLYVAAGLNVPNPPYETAGTLRAGIYILSSRGKLLEFVPIANDEVTNCAFGGADRKTLFVTAGGHLWSIAVGTPGIKTATTQSK